MNPKRPNENQDPNPKGVEVAGNGNADAALEKLRPFLKPEKAGEARLVLTTIVSKSHSGPIPSAEELEHLERVLPGAANRCFEMAEREQAHRHHISTDIVSKEFALRDKGQLFGLLALILLLVVVVLLGYLGDTEAAAWLGGVTIVGVVSIFVTGKFIENREGADIDENNTPSSQGSEKNNQKKIGAKRR